jgi:hypothetical protein
MAVHATVDTEHAGETACRAEAATESAEPGTEGAELAMDAARLATDSSALAIEPRELAKRRGARAIELAEHPTGPSARGLLGAPGDPSLHV